MTTETTTATLTKIYNELIEKFNPNNYDSLEIGSYLETSEGDFMLTDRPNICQDLNDRAWAFEQTTDSEGEPIMADGIKLRIK